MPQHQLNYKNSIINYYVYGNGVKSLLCLHGYNGSGQLFSFLEKHLGLNYTLIAPDFPFHGETKWKEKEAFTGEDLLAVFNSIKSVSTYSILAYSMGGRAAMHILKMVPRQICRLVLIAPDGLHMNFWYWLATQTATGNKLFKVAMCNPRWFFAVLKTAGKRNLINESIIKFVHYFLDDEEQRLLLYQRWTVMRKFKPELKAIKKISSAHNIQVRFLFGEYDRVILSKRADIFKHTRNIQVKIIDAGHQLLKEKHILEISALLYE